MPMLRRSWPACLCSDPRAQKSYGPYTRIGAIGIAKDPSVLKKVKGNAIWSGTEVPAVMLRARVGGPTLVVTMDALPAATGAAEEPSCNAPA